MSSKASGSKCKRSVVVTRVQDLQLALPQGEGLRELGVQVRHREQRRVEECHRRLAILVVICARQTLQGRVDEPPL